MDRNRQIADFLSSFERIGNGAHFVGLAPIPSQQNVASCAELLMELMFPGRCGCACSNRDIKWTVEQHYINFCYRLSDLIMVCYTHEGMEDKRANILTEDVMECVCQQLPEIRRMLKLDARAGYDGDPACSSVQEAILTYPFIKTITVHRLAHLLYTRQVPVLPRMLSEWAHKETGIDIHPGATIGKSFFIDHGTGVVVGETAVIGDNVKLYQGVTLGALSFPRNACGLLIRNAKRHPTIEDNVTIYANATILGDIVIGKGSTIGSSVWIKDSIEPDSVVMLQEPKTVIRKKRLPQSGS